MGTIKQLTVNRGTNKKKWDERSGIETVKMLFVHIGSEPSHER